MEVRRALFKPVSSILSPAGKRGRLTILIYHRVLQGHDPMRPKEVDAGTFEWQMKLMADRFNVLPLSDACACLEEGTLPARAACITFDDGYADNIEVAVPILKRWGLVATFFIATGFVNGGRMWNDTVIEMVRRARLPELDLSELELGRWETVTDEQKHGAAMGLIGQLRHMAYDARQQKVTALESLADGELPQNLMMTSGQVRRLVDEGMEVGAHTVSHPILARMDSERGAAEIGRSKAALEEIVGRPLTLFAYPNGKPGHDYEDRHVAMVRNAGFRAAVSTQWGAAGRTSDIYQLPRFTPWHRTPEAFHMALLRNYFWN